MENFPRIGYLVLLVAWLGPIILLFFRNVPPKTSILFAIGYFALLWTAGLIAALSGNTGIVVIVLALVVAAAWWKAFKM